MTDGDAKLVFSLTKIKTLLTALIVVLVLLNAVSIVFKYFLDHDFVYGFVPLFLLDAENNIPTYFSSVLLLSASCLLFVIYAVMKNGPQNYTHLWLYLAIIFLFLSIDESASIHELLNMPLRDARNITGFLYFPWVIIGLVLVIVIFIVYFPFILELPVGTKNKFILAGGVYVAGAVGCELLGGYFAYQFGESNLGYALITSIEETFELIGMGIFVYALVDFLQSEIVDIKTNITD